MDKILKDSRFAKIGTDKRFMTVSKKQKKVKIDKRFKSMFEDERFVSKCAVDKRGRPTNYTSKENYKKYYDLKDSDESESESDSDEKNLTKEDAKLPDKLDSDEDSLIGSFSKAPEVQTATSEDDDLSGDEDEDEDENVDKENLSSEPGQSQEFDPKVKSKLHDMTVDYARGEAALYSSDDDSSSGEDSSEDEDETVEMFDDWGELDKDAETTEDTTKRLAVCNMNWDRVKAEDIFLVMSSFGGSVKAVRIYMSDFGKERLAEEDDLGPKELRKEAAENDDEGDGELVGDMDEKMTETMALNRVRQYQVNKLKYYYAVVDFDTPETANMVYTECDGKEYELSASRFDLRFIPDEMVFDAEPTSSCLSPPTPESYKPKIFFTTALQQGKVDLTWDENDPERAVAMQKAFECDDGEIGDVKAFLASDSDDDDEVDRQESRIAPPSDESSDEDELEDKDTIEKYRALIADITQNEEKKSSAKGNMEVSWEENETVDAPEKETKKELTPWEKYLKKKQDKKSKKREKSLSKTEGKEDSISDDELPEGVDLSDPFFADELEKPIKKAKKVKKNKKPSDTVPEEEAPSALDLIVMDSDDDKNHFDFKQIRETENVDASKSKKKKWSKKKKKVEGSSIPTKKEDGFKVDVKDGRFSALFSSANYNIDPSDPYFKRTNAMDDLINEKQKRRKERKPDVIDQHVNKKKSKLDPELSQSLKSVKSKWNKNAKRKSGNTFIVKDI